MVATEGLFNPGTGPNVPGLSHKALMHAVDDSLKQLGTDYIDLSTNSPLG